MFYVKAIIPTTVTTGRLFWKKTRIIDKEKVGSIKPCHFAITTITKEA